MPPQARSQTAPPPPAVPAPAGDEGDLPEGWAVATLGECSDLNPRHPNNIDDATPVTFVAMPSVRESSPDVDTSKVRPLSEVRKGYTHFADGDVLFAKITPCMENGKGAVANGLTNGMGCGSTELHVIRPRGVIDPYFAYRFLQQESVRRSAAENFTGSAGQLRVPTSFVSELAIPLPPLAEQRRIVGVLEGLLGKVAASRERLARVPQLLKRFRQSVLAAACSGKLTADWREENTSVDSGIELNSLLKKAEARRGTTEPTEGRELIADVIPSTWQLPTIEEVFRIIDYRGRNPEKSETGKRLISAKNIRMGYISDEPIEFISNETYAEWMTRGFPRRGDIFFITEGATMGFVALNDREDEIALAQRTLTLQPFEETLDTKVFAYFLMSKTFQDLVILNATGSAAVGIKGAKFRGLPIPFPPLAEQHEIVRRVEQLFALADRLEAQLDAARTRVDRLTQSILAKAFRGELVPTEADLARREARPYEPAHELLARIHRETKSIGNAQRERKPRSKGT